MQQKVASDRGVIQMSWSHRTPNKMQNHGSLLKILCILSVQISDVKGLKESSVKRCTRSVRQVQATYR